MMVRIGWKIYEFGQTVLGSHDFRSEVPLVALVERHLVKVFEHAATVSVS